MRAERQGGGDRSANAEGTLRCARGTDSIGKTGSSGMGRNRHASFHTGSLSPLEGGWVVINTVSSYWRLLIRQGLAPGSALRSPWLPHRGQEGWSGVDARS